MITYTFDTYFTPSYVMLCKLPPRSTPPTALSPAWAHLTTLRKPRYFSYVQTKNELVLVKNLDVAQTFTALNVITRGLFS